MYFQIWDKIMTTNSYKPASPLCFRKSQKIAYCHCIYQAFSSYIGLLKTVSKAGHRYVVMCMILSLFSLSHTITPFAVKENGSRSSPNMTQN
jgi:hypothetical protein